MCCLRRSHRGRGREQHAGPSDHPAPQHVPAKGAQVSAARPAGHLDRGLAAFPVRTPRYWHGVAPPCALSARELGSLMPSFMPSSHQPSNVPGIQLGNTWCICVECHETQNTQNSRISHSTITQKLPPKYLESLSSSQHLHKGSPCSPMCHTQGRGAAPTVSVPWQF